jgi:subtilisin family serine protease
MKLKISFVFAISFMLMIQPLALSNFADAQKNPSQMIIVFDDSISHPSDIANEMSKKHNFAISHFYKHSIKGYSATLPDAILDKIQSDSRVKFVQKDYQVSISAPPQDKGKKKDSGSSGETNPAQTIPTGILRINGDKSSTQSGNGNGNTNVGVAILDTGISRHSDLNVAGGANFLKGKFSNYSDKNGHGTHVAGIIAAKDNDLGIVGVAPGASLYAVKVLDNNGNGNLSDILAGLDWISANSEKIDVVNMSISTSGNDSVCGGTDALHNAICNVVSQGITFVVSAGNDSINSQNVIPATYPEVITVSALSDFDGVSGGMGSSTCSSDKDDSFASYSNYGSDVDIISPGTCIESTWINNEYRVLSGTSMASPHVAGAAALYLTSHPTATPEQVKSALINLGSFDWDGTSDLDGIKEPLLDVSGM